MTHVYRKYVTTNFNYKKALAVIKLFKKVDIIDTKEKDKMIIMLKVLHENQEDIECVDEKDKLLGSPDLFKNFCFIDSKFFRTLPII